MKRDHRISGVRVGPEACEVKYLCVIKALFFSVFFGVDVYGLAGILDFHFHFAGLE